ncbi:MAG: hypothetical protein R3A48_05860 [Polyangiales bacterium]
MRRAVVALAILAAVFAAYWGVLPLVRAWLQPVAAPGEWVLGPARALRFGACTILSAMTAPLLLRAVIRPPPPQAPDPARDLLERAPVLRSALLIKGALLFVVYAVCGAFYLTSYTEVGADRLAIHSPLGVRTYSYDHITALSLTPPRGGQPARYGMQFRDDRWGYFGADREGVSEADVAAVAAHIAARVGRGWPAAGDAR